MVGILGANSVSGGYEIDNSVRFNDNDSPELDITYGSAGNRRTFTWSGWIKRSNITQNTTLFANGEGGTSYFKIKINEADKLYIVTEDGSTLYRILSTQVLRDSSAWYHIVAVIDTTDGTAGNRLRQYINGVEVTAFDIEAQPSQNYETLMNTASKHDIGYAHYSGSEFLDGYMAEIHFIDGSAKAPSDFGEFDDNGVWIPKAYDGSYGTNGFYLEFKQTGTSANASGIGADTSGNDNHFTPTNLAATDITTDTPTNNFMTLNPLAKAALAGNPSEGNLIHVGQTSGYIQTVLGTLAWHGSGGKWYWEMEQGGATAGNYGFVRTDKPDGTNGVGNIVQTTSSTPSEVIAYDWGWGVNPSNGNSRHDGSNDSYGSSLGNGDHGMVAVDTVAGKAWWGKNGTWFNSGNPATGANPAFTDSDMTEGIFTIYSSVSDTDGRIKRYNFGNRKW